MMTPINRRHFNLIRGGAAANAAHHDPLPELADTADTRSPLARNVESLVLDAYEAGLQHGEPRHYRAGWRMGLVSGLLPGALSGGALVMLVQWLGGGL